MRYVAVRVVFFTEDSVSMSAEPGKQCAQIFGGGGWVGGGAPEGAAEQLAQAWGCQHVGVRHCFSFANPMFELCCQCGALMLGAHGLVRCKAPAPLR